MENKKKDEIFEKIMTENPMIAKAHQKFYRIYSG